jgi:hypothetical protein
MDKGSRGSSLNAFSRACAQRSVIGAVTAALFVASFSPRAAAQTRDAKSACIAAYESSQVLRKEGHLQAARDALAICTRDECPTLVRTDCAGWLAEVDAALPSIVLQASADGEEIADVTVYVDGTLVKTTLDGKATPIDPGPHALRFESPRFPPIDMPVVIREGEHYRALRVAFASIKPPPETAAVRTSRPVPLPAWIFGGVSVAALGSFVGFAISGFERKEALRTQCAPFCSASEVDTVQHRYFAADLSLAIAGASLGLASFFYFTRAEVPVRVGVAPALSVDGRLAGALHVAGDF